MPEFDIQPIGEKDIESVAHIMSERWEESLEWSLAETRKYLAQDAVSAGFCVHLNGELAGVGLFSLHNGDVSTKYGPWFYLLWVYPEYRGHDLGIELTKRRMEHARKCGYKEVYIDTVDAEPYHRKLGWEEIERIHRNGSVTIIMRWNLSKEFPVKMEDKEKITNFQ